MNDEFKNETLSPLPRIGVINLANDKSLPVIKMLKSYPAKVIHINIEDINLYSHKDLDGIYISGDNESDRLRFHLETLRTHFDIPIFLQESPRWSKSEFKNLLPYCDDVFEPLSQAGEMSVRLKSHLWNYQIKKEMQDYQDYYLRETDKAQNIMIEMQKQRPFLWRNHDTQSPISLKIQNALPVAHINNRNDVNTYKCNTYIWNLDLEPQHILFYMVIDGVFSSLLLSLTINLFLRKNMNVTYKNADEIISCLMPMISNLGIDCQFMVFLTNEIDNIFDFKTHGTGFLVVGKGEDRPIDVQPAENTLTLAHQFIVFNALKNMPDLEDLKDFESVKSFLDQKSISYILMEK